MKRSISKVFWIVIVYTLICIAVSTASYAATSSFAIGSKSYATLASAFKEVKSGQTIKMMANATLDKWTAYSKKGVKCTLDLNAKKLTVAPTALIYVDAGSLTIKGGKRGQMVKKGKSGTLAATSPSGSSLTIKGGKYNGAFRNNGTMIIENGTFQNVKTNLVSLFSNYGKLTIKKGTFTDASKCDLVNNGKKGITIIYNGKFSKKDAFNSEYTDCYQPDQNSSAIINNQSTAKKAVTIKNGNFASNGLVIKSFNGAVFIKKGVFTSKGAGVIYNGGSSAISLSGGTYKETRKGWGLFYNHGKGSMTIKGGTYSSLWSLVENYDSGCRLAISGGKFMTSAEKGALILNFDGVGTISGGTFIGNKAYGYWKNKGDIKVSGNASFNVVSIVASGKL